jgi:hypothetical protein
MASTRCRRITPCQPSGGIAQLVEHMTENHGVPGSNPGPATPTTFRFFPVQAANAEFFGFSDRPLIRPFPGGVAVRVAVKILAHYIIEEVFQIGDPY